MLDLLEVRDHLRHYRSPGLSLSRDYIGASVLVKLSAINFMSCDSSMITFEHVLEN
jgi:hypothetical protein